MTPQTSYSTNTRRIERMSEATPNQVIAVVHDMLEKDPDVDPTKAFYAVRGELGQIPLKKAEFEGLLLGVKEKMEIPLYMQLAQYEKDINEYSGKLVHAIDNAEAEDYADLRMLRDCRQDLMSGMETCFLSGMKDLRNLCELNAHRYKAILSILAEAAEVGLV